MGGNGRILVGTVGQGVLASPDYGERWNRVGVNQGMHSDCIVRDMISDPRQPEVVYAGSDMGLYRTGDGGAHWQLLDTAMNGQTVWALAIDPVDPNIMYAGTGTPSTPGIYRSTDSGKTWEQRPMEIAEWCDNVGVPRILSITVDPVDHRNVWVGIEVDGLRRSTDGGDTFPRAGDQIPILDFHDVAVIPGPPKTVFCVVNDDVWISTDDGVAWNAVGAQQNFPDFGIPDDHRGRKNSPRSMAVKPDDSGVVFVALGDSTPGRTGTVMRSKDAGKTWESLPLPTPPNSAMWRVHMQPMNPNTMFAASRYGYLYRSEDGGDSWTKLWREFSEVSSMVWLPN